MKLYEISEQLRAFQTLAEDGYYEDEQVVKDTLESIQMEFDAKIENIACMYKGLNAEADAIDAEIKSLSERASRIRKTCDWLKDYMSANLRSIGQSKFETPRVRLSFRKSESLQVTNEEVLFAACRAWDENLVKVERVVKFDKKSIKQAIKDGAPLDGAEIITTQNMQIK